MNIDYYQYLGNNFFRILDGKRLFSNIYAEKDKNVFLEPILLVLFSPNMDSIMPRETVEKWKNVCLKYEFTKNEALLRRILPEIGPQLYKEQACLSRFVNSGINKALLCENYL